MKNADSAFVHIIADYGSADDMAFAEVRQALRYEMRDKIAHMEASSVPCFDTVATGFKLGQLAINHRLGDRQLFYVNTAPRRDTSKARENNAGEGLAYAKLKNGVQIVAVNSGHSLSFIKDHAETIRLINCSAEGSQFRSRDVFPAAFGLIAHGDYSQLGTEIAEDVPDMPVNAVAYTDGYGNIKTTIDTAQIETHKGKTLAITINGMTHEGRVSDGIFQSVEGDLVMSAGSSGWQRSNGLQLRFVEISVRGGSAAAKFGHPKGGAEVKWA
jgi:hypothetical protein